MRNGVDMVWTWCGHGVALWTLDIVQELVILEIPAGFILLLQKFCINWDVDFSVVAFPSPSWSGNMERPGETDC